MADQVLYNAVKGVSDIITQQGVVNVDFADAVSVISGHAGYPFGFPFDRFLEHLGRPAAPLGHLSGPNRFVLTLNASVSTAKPERVTIRSQRQRIPNQLTQPTKLLS